MYQRLGWAYVRETNYKKENRKSMGMALLNLLSFSWPLPNTVNEREANDEIDFSRAMKDFKPNKNLFSTENSFSCSSYFPFASLVHICRRPSEGKKGKYCCGKRTCAPAMKNDVSNPKNQAERAPILLSRAWSGLDTSFHESYRWCWD